MHSFGRVSAGTQSAHRRHGIKIVCICVGGLWLQAMHIMFSNQKMLALDAQSPKQLEADTTSGE